METAVLGVFLSLNLVLYYFFWEGMLIPMYFIIGIWGGPTVFMRPSSSSSTRWSAPWSCWSPSWLPVCGVRLADTFDLPVLQQYIANGTIVFKGAAEMLLFVGFFLAFGIKAPIWPFHTWVPDAYAEAPTGGTIMLVALKMGLYGFIRFCLPLFPHAVRDAAPIIVFLSVIGVIYAA